MFLVPRCVLCYERPVTTTDLGHDPRVPPIAQEDVDASDEHSSPHGMVGRLGVWASREVDGASMAMFRIALGLVVVWEAYRYVDHAWIGRYWIDPVYHFTYPGFGWVVPLSGTGMYVVWGGIALSGLLIALGAWYRTATWSFALLFTYQFLLECGRYLNHFYLMCLIGWILVVIPAHRTWSVDALITRPSRATVPRWSLWLLQFQIAVMYVGGGIAKLMPDWLRGQPLSTWLQDHETWPVVGPLFALPETGVVLAWAGSALDLLIVPAVLWRPTRVAALVSIALFHLANARLFQIGVFPVLAMAATLVLLSPDWPRVAWGALREGSSRGGRRVREVSSHPVTQRPPPQGGCLGSPSRCWRATSASRCCCPSAIWPMPVM